MAIPQRRLRAIACRAGAFVLIALAATLSLKAQAATPTEAKALGDFRLAVDPGSIATSRENSVATYVVLNSIDQYNKPTALSVADLPAGITASFSQSSLTPPANGSVRSKLSLAIAAGVAPGTYPITVTGRYNALAHSATVELIVTDQSGFKVTVPGTQHIVTIGNSSRLNVTVTGTAYTEPVTLDVSGLPAGVSAVFSLNPVNPGAKAAVNSTLTFSASTQAAQGKYPLTITGTSNGTVRSTALNLYVNPTPDFTLWTIGRSRALVAVTQQAGISGWLEINARPLHGWNQAIEFSMEDLPPGVSATFSPAVVNPYGPTAIAFTASAETPVGRYTANVVATGATSTHRLPVELTVLPYLDASRLPNDVTRVGLSLRAGESLLFNIMKPETGALYTALNTQAGFGTGRGKLYVREGAPPTATDFHCRTTGNWSTFCKVERNPDADFPMTYFLRLTADTDISGGSIMASYGERNDGRWPTRRSNPTDYLINDNTVVESPIVVSDLSGNGGLASVSYNLNHAYRTDLKVELIAPDGQIYLLRDHVNGPVNPSATHRFDFTDKVANGTWKLRVTDDVTGGSGVLLGWQLDFFDRAQ
ncbi:proprotein convertase P-domain-containing protein [Pseudomonas sp. CGJS7]|uniref:proprotein convertase P-domain-containing protein n=1 Tax=Pseudomonas sp. CGJS7 TaxID=3109348 RepID=UPI00300BEAFA